MLKLYPDQSACLDNLLDKLQEGYRSPLLVAPCGFGKTVVFSEITRRAKAKGNSVLICVHRQELLRQTYKTLEKFGVSYGVIASGYPDRYGELIQVATIQTLARRLGRIRYKPKLIIFDECHHALSPTFLKVINHFSDSKIIGVTATPYRLDGQSLNKVFDCMVIGATADVLIKNKRLAKPIYYAPPQRFELDNLKTQMGDYDKVEVEKRIDKPFITGDVIEHYSRLCYGKKAVVFCVSVRHAEHVAQQFNNAGIPSASIDGSMIQEDRMAIIRKLENGNIKVLTSCELISEGFDLPSIEVAIMLRPTQSLCIWIQQAGRALRISEGKDKAIILDHVGNIFRHGAIENITEWSLTGMEKRIKSKETLPTVRRCKNCFAIITGSKCQECGSEPELTEKELKIKEGELKALEISEIKKENKKQQGKCRTLDELIELGISRGYKNPRGWAYAVYNSRQRIHRR